MLYFDLIPITLDKTQLLLLSLAYFFFPWTAKNTHANLDFYLRSNKFWRIILCMPLCAVAFSELLSYFHHYSTEKIYLCCQNPYIAFPTPIKGQVPALEQLETWQWHSYTMLAQDYF